MNEFKGTPGPWSLQVEACDQTVALDIMGCGVCVSSAIPWSSDTECDVDKAVANANLIAAAPELLEALQLCEEFMSLLPSTGFDGLARIEGARAAIAKALGEIK